MAKKAKLAFKQLEKELSQLSTLEQHSLLGGIQRDSNGNIIFVATSSGYVSHPSGSSTSVIMGYIYADDGTPIVAYKNTGSNPGWDTDCHGVTFGSGQYWINDDQVGAILSGDNYMNMYDGSYNPGDVVVYYDSAGNVVHSATITSTDGSSGTIVYGQGGLETYNHYDPIGSGFSSYSYYKVFRMGDYYG